MDDETLARFAELAVDFGANLQPGQIVSLSGAPGKERLVRAIAERAYQKGAKFVDLSWFDPWIKRARIEYAPDDTLEYVPPWYGERILAIGRERGAAITLSGPVAPGLLDDLDPVRSGRDRLPAIRETRRGRQPPRAQLDDPPRPDARPGRSSCTPTSSPTPRWPSSRSSCCTSCASTRPTRSRPGRRAPTRSSPPPAGSRSAASTRCTTKARIPT